LVEPAAAQIAAELAYQRGVETKQLLAGGRPPKRALAVGDKAVHRDAHRVDQHAFNGSLGRCSITSASPSRTSRRPSASIAPSWASWVSSPAMRTPTWS